MNITKLYMVICMFCFISCSRDNVDIGENPFQQKTGDTNKDSTNLALADSFNFYSIYSDLFLPTCANSGCHDGNFEPDFRTVESAYYGLVNKTVIKRDIAGNFSSRVVPYNHEQSMLWQRLHIDLNGNSGIMPLSLEPNSDYPKNKARYMNRLKNWIDSGAKDMFGNAPLNENFPPVIQGIRLKQNNQWLPRTGVYEPVSVSYQNGPVEIYLSLHDKEASFGVTDEVKVYFSSRPDSFGIEPNTSLMPISDEIMPGLFEELTNYKWKFDFDPASYAPSEVVWMRFEFKHDSHLFQLPSSTSMFLIKKYAAIKIQL